MFDNYLIDNHKDDIITILKDEDAEKHFSVIINFGKLFENYAEICNNLLEKPRKTLRKLNQEALRAQKKLSEERSEYTEKRNVHIRISGLPACPELHRTIFPDNNDLGAFLQISGTVVRMTASKMLEYQRNYRCTKCKQISTIKADYEQRFVFQPPKFCTKNDCNNKNMMQINELAPGNCKDYQEVRLQEQTSKLSLGTIPTSMWVTLEDDLVDCCKPGDDITVCGVVMRRWKPVANKKLDVELVLRVNYVEVNNDQRSIRLITPEVKTHFNDFWEVYKHSPLVGRDIILRSICPELYGLYIVKLAVAVILVGGSQFQKNESSEIKIRSEPHLLLVGDPGMGKSQLLRFASRVIPRSILTTGIGCTSAGLTVAAVMEEGEWHLEAGALVLSDGGICCIDEFNSMKEHDKASIHEAMEQQTISVAKASMVCKLNTRCTVLAAMNNKDKSVQVAMSSPLLSRFDLVLLLRDSFNPNWDEIVCDFVLNNQTIDTDKNDKQLWPIELIQAYFTVIKGLHPVLTDEANSVLRAYYQAQRQAPERNKARTTVRLLDSLVRLSQAHARLMFRSEVLVMDAVMAVALIESSMQGGSAILLPVSDDSLHAPFPSDPIQTYKELMSKILQKLKLYSVFNNELSKIRQHSNKNQNNESNYFDMDNSIKCDKSDNDLENIILNNDENDSKKINLNKTVNQDINEVFKKPDNKRKRSDDKPIKKSKKMKNTTLNDAELINLVPSVNDVFELDGMDLSFDLDFKPYEEPLTQDKIENIKKTSKELKNKFSFKNDKHLCLNNDNKKLQDNSPIHDDTSDQKRNTNKNEKTLDVSSVTKSIRDNSDKNENLNDSSEFNNENKRLNESFSDDKKEKSNSFEFLQQFAFKKTPKKDAEIINSDTIGETSKLLKNHENCNVSKSNEFETFSRNSSQLTAKTLFQSQDDNFDDLNLEL